MLISERYDESLKNIQYKSEYDIRIHAIQSAILILIDTLFPGTEVDVSNINYGYYCPTTEGIIKQFQTLNNKTATGILDEEIWNLIFAYLKNIKGCTIIQTGQKSISIVEIDKYLQNDVQISYENNSEIKSNTDTNLSYSNTDNGGVSYTDLNGTFLDYLKNLVPNGYDTSYIETIYKDGIGGKTFDEVIYEYIVSGGSIYNNVSFGYNISNSGESWHSDYLTPLQYNVSGSANKDYDYIYNLLANTIYTGNVDLSPTNVSFSNNNIGKFSGKYGNSTNQSFFSNEGYTDAYFSGRIKTLRKRKFDIEIIYGAKATKSRKIIGVIPISVSQEIDASGEPIYDVYEFIAKDVIDGIE